VFGKNTLLRAHLFEWHKRFSEGREDVAWPSGNDEN
jgi:hypothetical protein